MFASLRRAVRPKCARRFRRLIVEAFEPRRLLAPFAADDSITVLQGKWTHIPGEALLGNDFNPSGERLLFHEFTQPAHGRISRDGDGFTYYAPSDYHGPDSFTYVVVGAEITPPSNPATVSVWVEHVNRTPYANRDSSTHRELGGDAYNVIYGQPLQIAAPGLLAKDFDPDGDMITAQLLIAPHDDRGNPAGTVTVNPDGSFTYVPPDEPISPYPLVAIYFDYVVRDSSPWNGNQSSVGRAIISLGRESYDITNPRFNAENDTYIATQDTLLDVAAPGVLANDSALSGKPLYAGVNRQPENGTVQMQPDGSFQYTPKPGFVGTDTFTYKITLKYPVNSHFWPYSTSTVSIRVASPSGPPVRADNDRYSLLEDSSLSVGGFGVLENDVDPQGLPRTAVLETAPSHGTVDLRPDGSFVYTPDRGYTGSDLFTYRASNQVQVPPSLPAAVMLTIVDKETSSAPVVRDDQLDASGWLNFEPGELGLLANDADADGDILRTYLVSPPTHGRVQLELDGRFSFYGGDGYVGPSTFQYVVSDGVHTSNVATVSINVLPFNVAPNGYNGSDGWRVTTAPFSVSAPGVLFHVTDANNDVLSAVLDQPPLHGKLTLNPDGSFVYLPEDGFTGRDSFTFHASDGKLNSSTRVAVLDVTLQPTPPILASEDNYVTPHATVLQGNVLSNDYDPLGAPLHADLVNPPKLGSLKLEADGRFSYTPFEGNAGADSFTYLATNGQTTSTPTKVSISIVHLGENNAPAANNDLYYTFVIPNPPSGSPIANEITIAGPGVLTNDTDAERDTLTAELIDPPLHGRFEFNSDGSFKYKPDLDFGGLDHFTYRVSDGQLAGNIATVGIHVLAPNRRPTFAKGPDITLINTAGRRDVAGWATDISAGAPDEVDQSLQFVVQTNTNPQLFSLQPRIDATGKLTFGLTSSASGSAEITVALKDDGGTANFGLDASLSQTFIIRSHAPRLLHNAARPLDADADSHVSAGDALLVIDYLNAFGSRAASSVNALSAGKTMYIDVDGDNFISASDALMVINHLNAFGPSGEGEAQSASAAADAQESASGDVSSTAPSAEDDLIALLASDVTQRKKSSR